MRGNLVSDPIASIVHMCKARAGGMFARRIERNNTQRLLKPELARMLLALGNNSDTERASK